VPQLIIPFALSTALSLVVRELSPKPTNLSDNQPTQVNSPEVRFTEKQSLLPKRIIYGLAETGGGICFERVKPPYLYRTFLLCDEPIAGLRRVRIEKNNLFFDGLTNNAIRSPIATDGQANYPGRMKVCFRDGDPNQTIDALLASDFPSLAATYRQQGVATVTVRHDYGADWDERQNLWGSADAPDLMFLLEGIGVPDPRKPTNTIFYDPNDLDEANAARATWTRGVNNAALVQAHFLTQPYGGKYRPDQIDWDKVIKAADYDDEFIGVKDGVPIRRHTIDAAIKLSGQKPSDIIETFKTANGGFILNSGSRCWPTSSLPLDPVATIHDGLIAGGIQYRDGLPQREAVNRLKVRFIVDERNYQLDDGPILDRTDLRAIDGEPLDDTLELPCTRDDRRAQRLQKRYLDQKRLGKTLTVPVDVSYLADCKGLLVGYPHRFETVNFKKSNGIYFCRKATFAAGFASISLDLIEYDKSIESDWIPERDEQTFVLTDLDLD